MRILVLSGGGVKGAFQVGALRTRMMSMSVPYDAIFGVSTGALTGGIMAQGSTHEEQFHYLQQAEKLYLGIKGNHSIVKQSGTLLGKLWDLLHRGALMDPSPLRELVYKHIQPTKLAMSSTAFGAGYVDLATGKYQLGWGGDPFIQARIMDSASQPFFFALEGPRADGGLRNMTPMADAIAYYKNNEHETPLHIDVILCNPLHDLAYRPVLHKNTIDVLSRTFEIIMHEMFMADIKHTVRRSQYPRMDDVRAEIYVVAPPVALGNGLEFQPERIRKMIAMGEAAGRYFVDGPKVVELMGDPDEDR